MSNMFLRKKIWIPITVILICLYILVVKSTDSVIDDFNACIRCTPEAQQLRSSALYNRYYDDCDGRVVDGNVSVKRLFVLHNFNKGFMHVIYTCERLDSAGSRLASSSDVTSTWFIEKQNGKWVVTAIREDP